jgi:hypothetical protein
MASATTVLIALLVPSAATTDATFGRLEGDLSLVLGAGATLGPRGARATADFRLRLLDSAGWFAGYEDSAGTSADPIRVLYTGMELRPLFLGRWLTGLEFGQRFADLCVDSLGLEIGAFAAQPAEGGLGDRAGLQVGLGLEVPLAARAVGPWLAFHAGARLTEPALARGETSSVERALYLSITLAWHALFTTRIVDAGDAALR